MKEEIFPSRTPMLTEERASYLVTAIPPNRNPAPPTSELTPVLTQEIKDYEYRNYVIDLTIAHTDSPLGLIQLNVVADSMTIIEADSAFSYRLNSVSNDPTNAVTGMKEDQFEIREIYITNLAAIGNAVIRIVWNPRLIRIR